MESVRMWALWRRLVYGTGYFLIVTSLVTMIYFLYFYQIPTCFDIKKNGDEIGVDCGGTCVRICNFTVAPPVVKWAQSFPGNAGQFNAVAYVENSNKIAGTPELNYTFTLYDRTGVIAVRKGKTILPPDSMYPIFEGRIDTGGRAPVETTLVLESSDLWLPYAFGRAQFKTTDLVLTGADELPRLKAKIENNELVEAEDLEVVATIFDAAGTPLTASQTFVESLAPRGNHEVIFTWPNPIAKTLRSCEVPTDVILAIDLSGSMNNDGANPAEPITSVLAAAGSFVDQLNKNDQVGVVTFATKATSTFPLSNNLLMAQRSIKSLSINPKEENGYTNTGDGLVVSGSELESVRHNKNARSVIVLLTDGLATTPGSAEESSAYALEKAAIVKSNDVTVFTIGLGTAVNMDFLRSIASNPNQAYSAPTTATLSSIYQSITAAICEDGAAKIEIIPKTRSNFAPLQ